MSEKVYKRVKTPTVLQMEVVECGSACLTMVLAYYGKVIPLERMRIECGVTRDGVKASNIVRAGERLGLKCKAYKKEPNDLKYMKPPMIIHWNFNHFVVFEGFKRDKIYLNDPAVGHVAVSYEEFDKAFTGVVITFEPKEDFQKSGERMSTTRLLYHRLKHSKSAMVFLLVTGVLLTITGIVIPYFTEVFVDDILMGGKSSWLFPLLFAMAVAMVVQVFLMSLQKKYLLKLKTKLNVSGSSEFFLHLLRLPSEFFQQRSSSDLVSRMNNNSTIATFLTNRLAENSINVVMLIFYMAIMLKYSVELSIIVLVLALVNVVCYVYSSEKVTELTNKSMNDEGKLYSTMVSGLSTIETIKAIGSEADFFARWSGYHAKVLSNHQSIGKNEQILYSVPNFTKALSNIVVITIGSIKVIQGDANMTIGSLVAFQTLVANFMQPISSLTQMGMEIKSFQADMNRVNDVMQYKPTSNFDNFSKEVTDYECRLLDGNIDMKDVSFGYNLLDTPFVDKFNLSVRSGERVAIVGGSGSGKSTILKLLNGVNEKWSGDILFDNAKFESLSSFTKSNSISCVEQDISIFKGTIYDNITMWNTMVSESDVIQATKDAMIYDEISKRPLGFKDVMSSGGRNFSGGQCQRIEIARSLAINPSVILMDEATSALDPTTEKAVLDNIRRRGCTCIMVAHRLSTIRDCDKIIVMEHGRIVQQGTHEELKSVDGLYANLIKMV
jgi:NHLM bacteriocin system ABC transporter peptidase/ATP-binding protein